MGNENILEVFKELGTHERHFNNIQGVYRGLASTWFLGCFAAIGFLYTKADPQKIPFNPELISAVVSLAVSTCILLFWLLDVIVYHRLLVAVLEVAEAFENKHLDTVPALRSMMRNDTKAFRARLAITLYYFVPVIILQASGLVFLVHSWAAMGPKVRYLPLLWLVVLFVVTIVVLGCVVYETGKGKGRRAGSEERRAKG